MDALTELWVLKKPRKLLYRADLVMLLIFLTDYTILC